MDLDFMRRLADALEGWLTDLDRHAGCSDRFFRQVYTARARGFLAAGFLARLRAEIAARADRDPTSKEEIE